MKFPVPKTLHGALLPTLLINWVFGIGVIEYPVGRRRPMISAFSIIVNLVVYLGCLRMANLSQVTTFQKSKIAARSYHINTYIGAAFVISSMCFARINAKVANGILSKLTAINDRLNVLGISDNYESVFKAQIIQLAVGFSLMFSIMVLDFKYVGHDFPNELSRISFLIGVHYSLIFSFIVDCICNSSTRYFGNRFRCLNELLVEANLLKRSKPRETWSPRKQYPRYSSVINEIQRYSSMRAADQRWLLYVIREARKIHRGLCRMAMELNRAFGIQVLFSIASSFCLMITLLYSAYSHAVESPANRQMQHQWIHLLNLLLWNTFYAMRIFLIIDACETTSCEANQTEHLISNFLDCDEDIRDEISMISIAYFLWLFQINIFSLQLIQNPLNFTAYGFFPINYSLVRGIIGSATTYLVIMIQMRSIYEPEDKISTPDSTMPVQLDNAE